MLAKVVTCNGNLKGDLPLEIMLAVVKAMEISGLSARLVEDKNSMTLDINDSATVRVERGAGKARLIIASYYDSELAGDGEPVSIKYRTTPIQE